MLTARVFSQLRSLCAFRNARSCSADHARGGWKAQLGRSLAVMDNHTAWMSATGVPPMDFTWSSETDGLQPVRNRLRRESLTVIRQPWTWHSES